MKYISALLLVVLLCACTREESITTDPLFELLSSQQTGISFENTLTENLNGNVLMYEYFYNGGGVAVGDVNGDGLEDLYFTANMAPNKLYLNKGKLVFQDVTEAVGLQGRAQGWTTGATFADVNGDGLLDLYVCYSGNYPPEKRKNELYIHQGVGANGLPIYKEMAEAYGVASEATSTQATFFDYDRDGDLDLFLLNHNPKSLPVLNEVGTAQLLQKDDPMNGSRLYRNDGGKFKDVTRQAGLQSSALSYGLGVGVADLNSDGWPDVYISNDYQAPDHLYLNNGNGTFTDRGLSQLSHTSQFSMGSDLADVNNDALVDIFTLDMLPEDNRRQKLLMAPDNYEKFDLNVRLGFNHQYMRNMLQLNTGEGIYKEIGQWAGIANTDWSWAALWADYDNDGWKDLYVSNGYFRDYTNMDFLKFMSDFIQNKQDGMQRSDVLELVYKIPSSNLSNYAYRSQGEQIQFENVTQAWGLQRPSNSNGAAYVDLDKDGDLDLVVNNVNLPAFVYENKATVKTPHRYLQIGLTGNAPNTQGTGAKLYLYQGGKMQYAEQSPTRGYQSNVSFVLHFGVGQATQLDSVRVVWPSQKSQLLQKVSTNQRIQLTEKEAMQIPPANTPPSAPLFSSVQSPVAFTDAAVPFNDFYRQHLLVNPISYSSPILAKADVNGDGREDVFVGGGLGQSNELYVQSANGSFSRASATSWQESIAKQATAATFFDANGDGAPDLYVGYGGYGQLEAEDARLQDVLYLNDGKGNFTASPAALPAFLTSTGAVCAADFNGDGFVDAFVGGRVVPGRYPQAPRSYLLINDGKGNFNDQTATLAPQLQTVGMVTDAKSADFNADGKADLVVVGEWMPIQMFVQAQGLLTDRSDDYFDRAYPGFWNTIQVADLNGDKKPDLIAGNYGLNSQLRASEAEPLELYAADYDKNGTLDPILTYYVQGKRHPFVTRDELVQQISSMGARYPNYESYADQTLEDLFSAEGLKKAKYLRATDLSSRVFLSGADTKFSSLALPKEAQYSSVYSISLTDLNQDGRTDLLLFGNSSRGHLRLGRQSANVGLVLLADATGMGYVSASPSQSGLSIQGDVRSSLFVGNTLLLGINQQPIRALQLER